jgi:hypothetical protein
MPYIDQRERPRITWRHADGSLQLDVKEVGTPGELNYAITLLIKQYWEDHGERYAAINDIVGALECAKAEFYRRVVIPYEDGKIKEHGDVY